MLAIRSFTDVGGCEDFFGGRTRRASPGPDVAVKTRVVDKSEVLYGGPEIIMINGLPSGSLP